MLTEVVQINKTQINQISTLPHLEGLEQIVAVEVTADLLAKDVCTIAN